MTGKNNRCPQSCCVQPLAQEPMALCRCRGGQGLVRLVLVDCLVWQAVAIVPWASEGHQVLWLVRCSLSLVHSIKPHLLKPWPRPAAIMAYLEPSALHNSSCHITGQDASVPLGAWICTVAFQSRAHALVVEVELLLVVVFQTTPWGLESTTVFLPAETVESQLWVC